MGFYKYKDPLKALDDIRNYQRAITLVKERVNFVTFNERRSLTLLSCMAQCKIAHDTGEKELASYHARKIHKWVSAYARDAEKLASYITGQSNAIGWCYENGVSKSYVQDAIEKGIDDGKAESIKRGYIHG